VTFKGDGTYSRCVGEIFINGKSHSLALIKNGYAWWYSKYDPNRTYSENAHNSAKHSKLGLWATPKVQLLGRFVGNIKLSRKDQ
jgi:endonuclease YncB( thermonuclease family)